jgi:hypothetical protein
VSPDLKTSVSAPLSHSDNTVPILKLLIVFRQWFKITRNWRKLHKEELNNLYFTPNSVRVIKSRRIRWVRHVARLGEERGVYGILVGNPKGRESHGMIIRS